MASKRPHFVVDRVTSRSARALSRSTRRVWQRRSVAIRGPQGPRVPVSEQGTPGLKKDQPASPLSRLVEFGMARTPAEAKKLVAELLANLRAAGFPVPKTGSPESQLKTALENFQRADGVRADGVLDRGTFEALKDAGLLQRADDKGAGGAGDAGHASGAGGQVAEKSRTEIDKLRVMVGGGELGLPTGGEAPAHFEKGATGTEVSQKAEASARDKANAPQLDLKQFVSSMRSAGFAGRGQGAEQLKDAVRRLQQREGIPVTGRIDARTAEALVKRGVLSEAQARDLVPTLSQPSDARTKQDVTAQDAARTHNADAQKDATTRGTPDAGDGRATQGRGDTDGAREGARGEGVARDSANGAQRSDGAQDAREGRATGDGAHRDGLDGNAPSGDDRVDDERRGHASIGEDDVEEEGHYEVPALAQQIEEGLLEIERDDGGDGAATYAWDFTLYRPGVYGRRQSAEKLFHVVVAKASAFDQLWERAVDAINDKLDRYEPESARMDLTLVQQALKIARVR
jgi:hypothetical protein